MKLPRDLGGEELCGLLGRFDYTIVRRTGSHIRLTSNTQGKEHHITIPRHTPLKTGTLNGILNDVASNLKISKSELADRLLK